jgi:hypothetical protein
MRNKLILFDKDNNILFLYVILEFRDMQSKSKYSTTYKVTVLWIEIKINQILMFKIIKIIIFHQIPLVLHKNSQFIILILDLLVWFLIIYYLYVYYEFYMFVITYIYIYIYIYLFYMLPKVLKDSSITL